MTCTLPDKANEARASCNDRCSNATFGALREGRNHLPGRCTGYEANTVAKHAETMVMLPSGFQLFCFDPQEYHAGPVCSDVVQVLNAQALRHPAEVGAMQGRSFVPNDVHLGGPSPSFVLLTGPNMGGKSTLLRQVSFPAMPHTTSGPDSIAEQVFLCMTERWTASGILNMVHDQSRCIQEYLTSCWASMLVCQPSAGSTAAPWSQCLKCLQSIQALAVAVPAQDCATRSCIVSNRSSFF